MANEKHIFIGIGGSGCQTVSQIKSKVYEKRFKEATASKTRLQAMNDSYRFLFIDTDQRDIDEANKRNRESFEQGKVPFISPQTDLINLGRANPQAIYYEAKQDPNTLINKRILEACSPELAVKIPDQPLAFGAGAFRMKSRIAFAHALTDFQNKLQAAISSLNDVKTVGGEDCIIYYWVVGSTLGGTGSGIFNDVLYHVNQIHHQVVGNGDPQLVLTMYMPKVYIDSNSTEEIYTLNAFGVFSELQAFKKMSYEPKQNMVMHRLAFQNDYNLIDSDRRYCPFYYLIPIDIQTDKGTSLGTTRTMYRNTAEMLYHLHHGKAGATFRSDIDLKRARLALEDADISEVTFNGEPLSKEPDGFFTDEAIAAFPVGPVKRGLNTVEIRKPLAASTCVEDLVLLGDFGVTVRGAEKKIVPAARSLAYGDWTTQGFPFYSGAMTYRWHIRGGRKLRLKLGRFSAPCVTAELDGKRIANLSLSPSEADLGLLAPGEHILDITVYPSRINSFGTFHLNDRSVIWFGPQAWRSSGMRWTRTYRLEPSGLLSEPHLFSY